MNALRRARLPALCFAILLGATPLDGVAQDSTLTRADTARPGPAVAVAVPFPEPEVPRGPLPPGSRLVFTRDSLAWTSAITLADLLGAVPGVYIARAGFLGQSEYVVYGGRGAAALEIFWDGMPMPALGGDSLYADAARIYLTTLARVDVEILPATLRVYLVSERHGTLQDRSLVRVGSGDYASAQYVGLFQKRWPSGIGLDLLANHVGSNGFSGSNRQDRAFEINGRVDWRPTDRYGVTYQFRRQDQDRDVIPVALAPARHGTRTDAFLRAFASSRPRGQGFTGELLFGSSSWSRDTAVGEQGMHHVDATARFVSPRMSAQVTGTLGDVRITRALEGRASLYLPPGIILSGDASLERLRAGRTGKTAHGSVALFRGPVSVVGDIAWSHAPQAAALATDAAVRTLDRGIRVSLQTSILGGQAGFVHRDAYAPFAFPDITGVPGLGATLPTDNFIAEARIRLLPPLTVEGWYANPVKGSVAYQPPTHGRAQLTFRSKFWKKFRSGAFDLKIQAALESWSAGSAGLVAGGAPLTLNGVTFYEAYVSFQIVGFIAYWDLRNAMNALETYVPGLPYPRNAQTFGVRWEFFN